MTRSSAIEPRAVVLLVAGSLDQIVPARIAWAWEEKASPVIAANYILVSITAVVWCAAIGRARTSTATSTSRRIEATSSGGWCV